MITEQEIDEWIKKLCYKGLREKIKDKIDQDEKIGFIVSTGIILLLTLIIIGCFIGIHYI